LKGRRDYFEDEFRFGTRTELGKRWTAKGVRPVGKMNLGYDYGYLYVALNPGSGKAFGLILPSMEGECMKVFVQEFRRWLEAQGEAEAATLLVLDGAGSHRSGKVEYGGLNKELLPPYAPELNPVERFFQELRRAIKNQVYESYEAVEKAVEEVFKSYLGRPEAVQKLTNFHWLHTTPTY
jgi:DDE superfamily endonuclease